MHNENKKEDLTFEDQLQTSFIQGYMDGYKNLKYINVYEEDSKDFILYRQGYKHGQEDGNVDDRV